MKENDKILNSDRYMSYKEYQKICDNYNLEFDKNLLDKNNIEFINKKMSEYKEYFDNVFFEVGENIKIDDEQRKIILTDEDYCLINAGAGSGKSTTMAAKVKYLVDKLNINPKEIIMLSFTKKSSEDLDEKVNDLLELGIPVSTFHSLGMKFVRKFYPFPVKVVGNDEQKEIICSYIKQLYTDKVKMRELVELFKSCNKSNYIARGFIENYEKFNTFEEYFNDYKKRKCEIESNKNGGLDKYVENRLKNINSLYTIKGEKVKSIGEVRIANFLYCNGIEYVYEKIFDEKVNEDIAYQPDFTLEYQGKKIYIEYFGLSSCYTPGNTINRNELLRYQRNRKIKENFQKGSKEDFINLDYLTRDGYYIETLEKELGRRGIKLHKIDNKKIFDTILDSNLSAEFFKFSNLIIEFINIFKNMLVDDENYIFDKIIDQIYVEDFKYKCYYLDNKKEAECRVRAIKYLKSIYEYYQKYLIENNMVDYSDMINLSYKTIIKEVKNKYPEMNYRYIIVDEYQDITFQRFLFIKRLVEYFDAKLIAVGDDWQSIYAFAGSRVELFNKFNDLFLNSKNDMYLSTTYRYGQELVNITSDFILRNDKQSKKRIKSIKRLKDPIKIYRYTNNNEYDVINNLVKELYYKNPNKNIMLLARTNECINKLLKSVFFIKGINDSIICKEVPKARIQILTMHRAKGLTSDQVVVFGLRENLFPNKGKISHWIFEYFKLDTILDEIPYAEERRLFYVALTRTKNKVYLVTPSNVRNESRFVNEIEKNILSQ